MTTVEGVRTTSELIRRISEEITASLKSEEEPEPPDVMRTVDLDPVELIGESEDDSTPEPEPTEDIEPRDTIEPEPTEDLEPEPTEDLEPEEVVERALISILSVGARGLIAGAGIGAFVVVRLSWTVFRVALIVACRSAAANVLARQLLELPSGPPIIPTCRLIWDYTKYVERT